MKTSVIRQLDFYLGIPLCLLLTLINKAVSLVSGSSGSGPQPQKILFLKLIEQGASVLAYNAMCRAEEMVGRGNLYFCVFKENRPVLDLMDVLPVENIFEIRSSNLVIFACDLLRFFNWTRKNRIDTVIDMEFFSRASALISFLTGARIRVGCHRYAAGLPYRGDLMTHRVHYNPYMHAASFYSVLVESSVRSSDEMPMPKSQYVKSDEMLLLRWTPSDELKARVTRLIEDKLGASCSGWMIFLLNPNASDILPIRKWEREKFVELARRLAESRQQAVIIFTGSPNERDACEEIAGDIGLQQVISLAGCTTLEELFALYSISDILVTNDSGPGHFASMTTVKSIVMFGPESPHLFGPLGSNAAVVWKGLACSPCVSAFNHRNTVCTDNICMKLISVDEIFKIIEGLLKKAEEIDNGKEKAN